MSDLLSQRELPQFRSALLAWYDAHKRDLPWRKDRNPYHVWVSEIMLQQTRVAAVLDHYARFMNRFPTVQSLAAAREQSVLALWSGLGYYHRARRMHQAAKVIVRELGGQFPSRSEDWLNLPGIGRYTAAAVASIAFGEPIAVVDGNVERVIARLSGEPGGSGATWSEAQRLLDQERPGDFNQAIMELGATVCTPRGPECLVCPVVSWCRTRGEHVTKAPPQRKQKQLCYAFVQRGESVLLVQRDADAKLMAGMWELPQVKHPVKDEPPLARLRHSITDTDYEVLVFRVAAVGAQNGKQFSTKQWQKMALTGLARKILRKLNDHRGESPGAQAESKLR